MLQRIKSHYNNQVLRILTLIIIIICMLLGCVSALANTEIPDFRYSFEEKLSDDKQSTEIILRLGKIDNIIYQEVKVNEEVLTMITDKNDGSQLCKYKVSNNDDYIFTVKYTKTDNEGNNETKTQDLTYKVINIVQSKARSAKESTAALYGYNPSDLTPENFPDPNFLSFVGNQAEEMMHGSLDADSRNISNLKGLEYFSDYLESINIANNHIFEIPDFSQFQGVNSFYGSGQTVDILFTYDSSKKMYISYNTYTFHHGYNVPGYNSSTKHIELSTLTPTTNFSVDCEFYDLQAEQVTGTYSPIVDTVIPIDSTHFPNTDIRDYMLNTVDPNNDGILYLDREIANIKSLTLSNMDLSDGDLKGLEYFTKLTSLTITNSRLPSIDLSYFPLLESLDLTNNKLTAINLSKQDSLTSLILNKNNLKNLALSDNKKLKTVKVSNNKLLSIAGVQASVTALEAANQSVDIELSRVLTTTWWQSFSIPSSGSSIKVEGDATYNWSTQFFKINKMNGQKIGTFSYTTFPHSGISGTLNYTSPSGYYTPVTSINNAVTKVNKGSTINLTGTVSPVNATYKDIVWSVKSGTGASILNNKLTVTTPGTIVLTATVIDGTLLANYTQDVTVEVSDGIAFDETTFPDANFRKLLQDVHHVDSDNDNFLSTTELNKVILINDETLEPYNSSEYITSYQGIEYFTELQTLRLENFCISIDNNSPFDLTKNTKLSSLYVYNTDFDNTPECTASIDFSKCLNLTDLTLRGFKMNSSDVTKHTKLRNLRFYESMHLIRHMMVVL